jgi:hypothetical protein
MIMSQSRSHIIPSASRLQTANHPRNWFAALPVHAQECIFSLAGDRGQRVSAFVTCSTKKIEYVVRWHYEDQKFRNLLGTDNLDDQIT